MHRDLGQLDVLMMPDLSTRYCVCAQVTTAWGAFYVVSLYLPPSFPIDHHVPMLRRLALRIGRAPALIGGDVNATSSAWHAPSTNLRGTTTEDLLAQTDWEVINGPHQPATFSSTVGVTY